MVRLSTKEIGDQLEDEILARLCVLFTTIEKMPVNALGIDLHTPDLHLAIQAKNWKDPVGPKDVGHFLLTAAPYRNRWVIANHFTAAGRELAAKHQVGLFKVEEFRRMFPILEDRGKTFEVPNFEGTLRITPVRVEKVESSQAPMPVRLSTIQQISVSACLPPKNPYDNVGK